MEFVNTTFACHCVQIDGMMCEYNSEIYISEMYETRVIIYDVKRECMEKVKDKDKIVIVFRKNEKYITVITSYSTGNSYRNCKESEHETGITLRYISTKLLYGLRPNNDGIKFKSFTCEVTEGLELIGAYPYSIDNKNNAMDDVEMCVRGKNIFQSNVKGFSYFVAPKVSKDKDSIQLGMDYKIQYLSDEYITLEQVDELLEKMILFLGILCGEFVTTTVVYLCNENEICEYVGHCNFPKYEFKSLKNRLDTRSFLRKNFFKITDFGANLGNVAGIFEKTVGERKLAFEAYKQVLLDEETGVFTYNIFLKLMQIIEGYQRTIITEEEKKKFNETKNNIIEKLKEEDDKIFIKDHTTDNGDVFKQCLTNFISRGIEIISEITATQLNGKIKKLIFRIYNDRNVYTHASLSVKPILKETELERVNYCCAVFFRIVNLSEMGLSNEIIRRRLYFDRIFISYYRDLFGLDIKLNDDFEDTGEFDSQMWGYE